MFDTVINPVRTEYVTRTVNEYKAPTDESVRLLREMEEKARAEIFKSVRLDTNELKGVVHVWKDVLNCETKFHIQVQLNNKRCQTVIGLREWDSTEIRYDKIKAGIANLIAQEILLTVDNSIMDSIINYK